MTRILTFIMGLIWIAFGNGVRETGWAYRDQQTVPRWVGTLWIFCSIGFLFYAILMGKRSVEKPKYLICPKCQAPYDSKDAHYISALNVA
jgi:hypothetical protein